MLKFFILFSLSLSYAVYEIRAKENSEYVGHVTVAEPSDYYYNSMVGGNPRRYHYNSSKIIIPSFILLFLCL